MDETSRSPSSEVPRCVRAQGNRVPRALRRYADHLSVQRTTYPIAASRRRCSFGRQSVHLEAVRSTPCDGRITPGINPEVLRARILQCRGWWKRSSYETPDLTL